MNGSYLRMAADRQATGQVQSRVIPVITVEIRGPLRAFWMEDHMCKASEDLEDIWCG